LTLTRRDVHGSHNKQLFGRAKELSVKPVSCITLVDFSCKFFVLLMLKQSRGRRTWANMTTALNQRPGRQISAHTLRM